VSSLIAHSGHVYVGSRDGRLWRHAEVGAQPAMAFSVGFSSPLSALAIEPAARAGWSSDGSTARGRPALLVCGSVEGACAAELPLRSATEQQLTVRMEGTGTGMEGTGTGMEGTGTGIGLSTGVGLGAPSARYGARFDDPAAHAHHGADEGGFAACLATFGLPGEGLPGAAARALFSTSGGGGGGGGSGSAVLHIHSLRDGPGCGARLGRVPLDAPVTALLALAGGGALVGLASGAVARVLVPTCAVVGAHNGVNGLEWIVGAVVSAHNGAVALLARPPPLAGGASLARDGGGGSSGSGPSGGSGTIVSAGATDGTLRVWTLASGGGASTSHSQSPTKFTVAAGAAGVAGAELTCIESHPAAELCALLATTRPGVLLSADRRGLATCWAVGAADGTAPARGTAVGSSVRCSSREFPTAATAPATAPSVRPLPAATTSVAARLDGTPASPAPVPLPPQMDTPPVPTLLHAAPAYVYRGAPPPGGARRSSQ